MAGGLGDAFGVDPAIFRLTFVTLSFFGGGGMVLYALGWLFMPARDSRESIGERMLRRAGGPRSAGGIALIAVAVLVLLNTLGNVGGGLVWGAVMVAIGVLVFRSDGSGGVPGLGSVGGRSRAQATAGDQPPLATASAAHHAAGVTSAGGVGTAPPPDAPPPPADAPRPDRDDAALHEAALRELDEHTAAYAVPPPTMPPPVIDDDGWRPRPLAPKPPPPRPPSILGRITVAAMLIAIGTLALFDNLTALNVAIASYAAVALVIIGGGLLVGAVVGRARGLVPLGGVALIVMLLASLAPQLPRVPPGGAGDRVYVPETVADLQPTYQLGAGELQLDLTQLELDAGDDVEVDVMMGLGAMTVLVPPEVGVDVDADMRIGAIDALGRTSEGPGAATTFTTPAAEGRPTIDLDLVNGVGEIAVRRVYPEESS